MHKLDNLVFDFAWAENFEPDDWHIRRPLWYKEISTASCVLQEKEGKSSKLLEICTTTLKSTDGLK